MSILQVKVFSNTNSFVDVLSSHDDDSFVGFPLGSLLDAVSPSTGGEEVQGRYLFAVIDQGRPTLSLSRSSTDSPWILGRSRHARRVTDDVTTDLAINALASAVSDIPPFSTAGSEVFIGQEDVLDGLLNEITSILRKRGIPAHPSLPSFRSKVSYVTADVISAPAPLPHVPNLCIALATASDVDELVSHYLDFVVHGPQSATPEIARKVMQSSIQRREVWVCRAGTISQIVGYCAVGRATGRTIAIRNVYVSPQHRRQGIGEFMTRILTRLYLGVPLELYAGALDFSDASPPQGIKSEVCLNVADDRVEAMYRRCGFLFGASVPGSPDDAWIVSARRVFEH